MTNKRFSVAVRAAAILGLAASMMLAPEPIAGQGTGGAIFRLVTFDVNGDMRLGATAGNGENDILDVHNGIRWLIQSGAPEAQSLPYIPADMRALIEAGPRSTAAVRQVYQTLAARKAAGTLKEPGGQARVFHPSASVKLLAPVTNPSKIFGLPRQLSPRGRAGEPEVYELVLQIRRGSPGSGRHHRPSGSDYRWRPRAGELSFVVSTRAKNVSEAQAFDYVYGYTICNDVSARGLAQGEHPSQGSTISKGLDTFSPCGPYLTLKEEVPNPHSLALEAKINGKVFEMPNPNTSHLTFKIPRISRIFQGALRCCRATSCRRVCRHRSSR